MVETEKSHRRSRSDVAAAALRILDDRGLAELTMRNLAADLGVAPSALYWHFPNKQTLLAQLADTIVATGAPRIHDKPFAETIESAACALRDALLRYRDGAEVVSSTIALGLGAADAGATLERALREGGFGHDVSAMASRILLHFILGHVSQEQQRMHYESLGLAVSSEHDRSVEGEPNDTDEFLFGVRLLANGLRVTCS